MVQANDPTGIGAASSQFKPQPGWPNQRPPTNGRRLSEWTPVNSVTYSRYNPPVLDPNWGGIAQNVAVAVAATLLSAGIMSAF